ncbi:MAG TPA: DoxX family protein [Vineibacter sp.]|nr:DoxX family protein [Vineibacter sp.]
MLFFGLIAAITLLATLLSKVGVGGLADWRARMRWGLAIALIFAGVDHLVMPGRYLPMMPQAVPFPATVVLLTGLCEIAGAIGLLVPRTRRLAGIMLAIYFVCVFPANIRNAVHGVVVDGLPTVAWYYWVRLLFQPLVILWALHASGVIDLLGGRRSSRPAASSPAVMSP